MMRTRFHEFDDLMSALGKEFLFFANAPFLFSFSIHFMELQKKIQLLGSGEQSGENGHGTKINENSKIMILTTGIGFFRFFSGFVIGIGGLVCFILVWDGWTGRHDMK